MKKIYFYSLALVFGMLSCNNDDELLVILKQSGNLTVRLVDNAGDPLNEEEIVLTIGERELDSKLTDDNGFVDFGEVSAGSYSIHSELKYNARDYRVTKVAQVLSGSSKNLQLNVEEHVGSLTIKVTNYEGPVIGKNILVVSDKMYYEFNAIPLLLANGYKYTTDNNGEVIIPSLPSGFSYLIYTYDDVDYLEEQSGFHLGKGDERIINIYTY